MMKMSVKSVSLSDDVDDNWCMLWKKRLIINLFPFVQFAHLGKVGSNAAWECI